MTGAGAGAGASSGGSGGGAGGGGGGGVPPGFRFHPTDEELLHFYLKKKVSFEKFDMEVIREVDLNKIEPWDLQERCKIGSTPQNEWYFFSHKDRKYPTGSRTNRATHAGFWKATGRDKCIRNSFNKIGMRKTLVFYRGRAPHGHKSDWIMHEYRLEEYNSDNNNNNNDPPPNEDGWVICRVFKKKNLFKINTSNINNAQGVGGGGNMINNNNNNMMMMMSSSCDPSFTTNANHYISLVHPNPNLNYSHIPPPPPPLHDHDHDHDHYPPPPPPQLHDHNSNYHLKQLMLTTSTTGSNYDATASSSDDYMNRPPPPLITNNMLQVKQFMSSTTTGTCREVDDCEATTTTTTPAAYHSSGLEIECGDDHSSPPMLQVRSDDHHHQWDRLHPSSINHLSLRSEMDFWAYGK